MRRRSVLVAAAFAVGLQGIAASAGAVPYFTDDFSGPSSSANLVDIEGTYFFSAGKIGTTALRSYVRSVESGYTSLDFQADLVYSISGTGGPSGVFFGIGSGTEDAGYFEEPETAL